MSVGSFSLSVGDGSRSLVLLQIQQPPHSDLCFILGSVDRTSFSFLEPVLLVSTALESLVLIVPLGPFLPATCPLKAGGHRSVFSPCPPLATCPESCLHFWWLPPQQTLMRLSLWLQPTPSQPHISDAPRTRHQDVHLPSSVPRVLK